MKITGIILLFLTILIYPVVLFAENGLEIKSDVKAAYFVDDDNLLLSGYSQKIRGTDYFYRTAIPGFRETMIVRATDGNWSMEWETDTVPEQIETDYVSFVWAANLDATDRPVPMTLTLNGHQEVRFYLTRDREWKVQNEEGTSLWFTENITDPNDDYYGFMVLQVPAANLVPGEPLRLKVTGGREQSNAWFMTVKTPVREQMSVYSDPALFMENGKMFQPLTIDLIYLGSPGSALLKIGTEIEKGVDLIFGYNRFTARSPQVNMDTPAEAVLEAMGHKIVTEALIKPVRRWKMHFVQNTHTDIGYTRPQTEIMSDLIRHLDLALDYADETDHFPDDSRFRWTAENTWAVDQFLKNRTAEQIDRLRRRVEERRIELTGMYLNFDELPDEQSLARSLEPIDRIRSHGFEIQAAMQNDVNGIGWALSDYFSSLGVKYLNMGTHGHKALIAFDYPTAFWWESPSGNRMLAFRAEHYHTGNTRFHISREDFDYFEKELLAYLNELAGRGYPYDVMMIQHSGHLTDNSPPSIRPAEMIRKWNEKYEWPKLRLSVISDFFEEIEELHGGELPVYRAAWPDWWVDGFGSGAREVGATRQAHMDIIAGQGLLSMARLLGHELPEHSEQQMALSNDALLFYGEHTFGSHASVNDPYGKGTKEMRRLKESFAWEASRRTKLVQEDAFGLLQSHVSNLERTSVVIYNTTPQVRSGISRIFIDHETVPRGTHIRLRDESGRVHPAQLSEDIHGGSYWVLQINDIPSFGYRQFILEQVVDDVNRTLQPAWNQVFENEWYRLEIDSDQGVVTGLFDKELDIELVDKNAVWGFGQFIYERLGNRVELDQYYLETYDRYPLESVRYDGFQKGDVWDTIRFTGNTKAAVGDDGFSLEIKMYHHTKQLDFTYNIRKKPVIEPESIYISFPFALQDGEIFFDVPGSMVQAGVDQIPGSSNDWNMIQNVAMVRNQDTQIMMSSHEAPLMQLGNINTGRFEAGAKPDFPHIYGWPMNNYWVTNFNADQKGEFEWTYNITSGSNVNNSDAMMFAWNNRLPLLPRLVPGTSGSAARSASRSLIAPFPAHIHVVTVKPKGNGNILFHLRETDGRAVNVESLSYPEVKIWETDVNGNRLHEIPVQSAEFKPYQVRFLEVSVN